MGPVHLCFTYRGCNDGRAQFYSVITSGSGLKPACKGIDKKFSEIVICVSSLDSFRAVWYEQLEWHCFTWDFCQYVDFGY